MIQTQLNNSNSYSKYFKIFKNACFSIFLSSLISINSQAYQQVDRPIALVGDSPITIRDLEEFLVKKNQELNGTCKEKELFFTNIVLENGKENWRRNWQILTGWVLMLGATTK